MDLGLTVNLTSKRFISEGVVNNYGIGKEKVILQLAP
jgi:hypothetical protein